MHDEHKELILTCIVEGHRPREAPWLVVRSKSEPLWRDPGLKSAISVCGLISTKKKKKGIERRKEKKEEKKSASREWMIERSLKIFANVESGHH